VIAGLPRLHAITDEAVARRPDLDQLAAALAKGGGADLAFHARGRSLTGKEHHDLAIRLSAHPPVSLFINDRLDVALAVPCRGVQLGSESASVADARRLKADWWIGRSVHTPEEAESARAEGADYLIVGPVFATASHPGRPAAGVALVKAAAATGLPVIAIGGITPENAGGALDAGAHGVAAIGALWLAPNPAPAVERFLKLWKSR
jgi:thiamine-phosphate diphosphorylase